MSANAWLQGFNEQRRIAQRGHLRSAYATNDRLVMKCRELQQSLRDHESALAESHAEINEWNRACDSWRVHYEGLEAQLAEAMKVIDELAGAENNPLRKQAYADDTDFRIPRGPREGQHATVGDHAYFQKVAELCAGKFKNLGNWRKLIKEGGIFE